MVEIDILNGFVGKVISDCIDITVGVIKRADKNRKAENQTMEARIYQVTIDALNVFPYNKYKKEEKVYDAAESILKELKRGNSNYKESVREGLNMLSSEITENKCEDFLNLLCCEVCKAENRDLAVGPIIHQGEKISEQQQQMDKHMQEGFKNSCQNAEKILEVTRDVKHSLDEMNREKDCKMRNKSPVINRAGEYAEKWNKNVFLNDFNEEDENAGTEIKLSEIYIEECLPHYIWRKNIQSKDTLRDLLTKYIINVNDREMLLILGQPGIGKSTLITWIMANLVEKKDEIFVYQFAFDLKRVNWQGDDILEEIFEALRLKDEELKKRNRLGNFSLVITCREIM